MAQRRLAPDRKQVAGDHAHLVPIDESGVLPNPLVRRTSAERGKPPVVGGDGGHRKKVSVIGAVTVSPAAKHLGLYVSTLPDGYFDAGAVAAFLRDLLKHPRGTVVVVWDGGPNHKGPPVRDFLKRNKRLTPERLPAYAPDLNPVEAVWSWLKYGQLANDVPDGIPELDDEIVDRLVELTCEPGLLKALWGRSGLPFPKKSNR